MTNHGAWNYILPSIFKYLETKELTTAVQVCTMWKDIALSNLSLWKTVRLNKCKITNWENLKNILQKQSTQNLVLRDIKMENRDEFWNNFLTVIPQVTSLIKLELCECSTTIIQLVSEKCPQLKAFSAMWINGNESLSLGLILPNLKQCQEFRLRWKCEISTELKSISYFSISTEFYFDISLLRLVDDLMPLQQFIHLKHLSLTSIQGLNNMNEVIKTLINLETLELGPCYSLYNFGTNVLLQLKQLKRLRLENIQFHCAEDILKNIPKIQTLSCLELINLNLNDTYKFVADCLANCKNIKRLLITPKKRLRQIEFSSIVDSIKQLLTTLIHFVMSVPVHNYPFTQMEIFCDCTGDQVNTDSALVVETDENNTIEYKTAFENDELRKMQEEISTVLPNTRVIIIKMMPLLRSYWHPFLTRRTS